MPTGKAYLHSGKKPSVQLQIRNLIGRSKQLYDGAYCNKNINENGNFYVNAWLLESLWKFEKVAISTSQSH